MTSSYTLLGLKAEAQKLQPGLHIVATPIGNLKDITLRALEALAAADVVLAEEMKTRSARDAAALVAADLGLPHRRVYARALHLAGEES